MREFIRDGLLDFSEYEQGVLAHVKCMEDYGWTSSPGYPRLAPWGQYQVEFEGYIAEDREARGASLADLYRWEAECAALYWGGLSRIWDVSHSPTEAEEQKARYAVGSCLQEAGVETRQQSAREFFNLFMDEMTAGANVGPWIECIRSAEEQYFTSGTGIAIGP
ncbi:MAG: hypothetical protein KC482_05215 [Dehalococcoidia bacterium]|nr:hypothetical protein [Dehalococcoidia bacterium]